MHTKDVTSDARFITEVFVTEETDVTSAIMESSNVHLKPITLVERLTTEITRKSRGHKVSFIVIFKGDCRWNFATQT
jgi:hypothetical protein